jgi:hypothetical protein
MDYNPHCLLLRAHDKRQGKQRFPEIQCDPMPRAAPAVSAYGPAPVRLSTTARFAVELGFRWQRSGYQSIQMMTFRRYFPCPGLVDGGLARVFLDGRRSMAWNGRRLVAVQPIPRKDLRSNLPGLSALDPGAGADRSEYAKDLYNPPGDGLAPAWRSIDVAHLKPGRRCRRRC